MAFFNKTTAVLAMLSVSLLPSMALAQQASAAATMSTPTPNEFFQTVEIVRGLPLTMKQYTTLREDECIMGPTNLVAPMLEKLEKRGKLPCSEATFAKLDTINKSGSVLWLAMKVPGGIYVRTSDKGVNVSANRLVSGLYQFTSPDGRPIQSSDNYQMNGGAILGNTLGGLAQSFVGGPLTALTAGLMQRRNCCGQQQTPINNINYNLSNADSNSTAGSTVAITGGACLTCGPTPAQSATKP
jgi:hypothetical protein